MLPGNGSRRNAPVAGVLPRRRGVEDVAAALLGAAEVTVQHRLGRYIEVLPGRATEPEPLVSAEVERLVLDDGAARGTAELMLLERIHRRLVELAGVEGVVLTEVEAPSMNLVGTGLRHYVDRAAGAGAELGGIVVGLELEFLNSVDDRRDRPGITEGFEVGDRHRACRRWPVVLPVDGGVRRLADSAGITEGLAARRVHRNDTRLQHHHLGEVSSVERKVDNLLLLHHPGPTRLSNSAPRRRMQRSRFPLQCPRPG